MMWAAVEYVKNIWPFSGRRFNDLRVSDGIVKKLPIPENTKHFVYAIREPESQAVIYVLSVQNLSERSVLDAECLIREIKPDAVVVQVSRMNNPEISDSREGGTGMVSDGKNRGDEDTVPTSVFEVLRKCFVHKIRREKYEEVAGSLVLREIFGVNFNGHFLAAKKAAQEVGSSFLMLESPFVKCSTSVNEERDSDGESEVVSLGTGLSSVFNLHPSNLVPSRIGNSSVPINSGAFHVADDLQSRMVKSLSSYLVRSNPVSKFSGEEIRPLVDYEAPQFAKCVYPLLVDLHDIFSDIPSMNTALACAQKMLSDVNKGESVDSQLVSEVYAFQVAVEGLRIALNNAARSIKNPDSSSCEKFSDLPVEDKSHAILAEALKSQTKKYKSIVAVVDASALGGLRKQWRTNVPSEVKDMVDHLVTHFGDDDELSTHFSRRRLLADKPVVAVGAGATAIFGVSSLSKVVPASTYVKIATFHVPASLKLIMTQIQKALFFAFGPTKVVAPGMAKGSSAMKAAASAEKIRAVAHSVIASAEKTSLSAMRTAFYEIMRKRRVQPIGVLPWATFGCSIVTCSSLLVYGDGIECAAESCPAAPSIASLGRGIRSLHHTSELVRQKERSRIQKAIESLLYKYKNPSKLNKTG